MNIIANNIVHYRKKQKMTQRELAERLNISDKTVSRWETGKQIPDALTIPEIAKALNISIDALYGVDVQEEEEQVEESTGEYIRSKPVESRRTVIYQAFLCLGVFIFLIGNYTIMSIGFVISKILFIIGISVMFIATLVFAEYNRKCNDSYGYELFKYAGIAVLAVLFIVNILISNVAWSYAFLDWEIPFFSKYYIQDTVFVTILNLVVLGIGIAYRNYLKRKGYHICKSENVLIASMCILSLVFVIGYIIIHVYEPIKIVSIDNTGSVELKLTYIEQVYSILLMVTQILNYIFIIRIWKRKESNCKVVRIASFLIAIIAICGFAAFLYPYTQNNLYNLLCEQAIPKTAHFAIEKATISLHFGDENDGDWKYYELENTELLNQLLDLFYEIKLEKIDDNELVAEEKYFRGDDYEIKLFTYTGAYYWTFNTENCRKLCYAGDTYKITNAEEVGWDKFVELIQLQREMEVL